MRGSVANQVEAALSEDIPKREKKAVNPQSLFPTGSTLLNLCCSGTTRGGYVLGGIVTTPGGSSAGKSILAMSSMAEGIYDPRFDKYQFVRDDAEVADNFDTDYLFGEEFAKRVGKPPLGYSNTIEDFKHNVLTLTKKTAKNKNPSPVIYCLDSLDSLTSTAELEKEMKKALAAAKSKAAVDAIKGSYGTEKAKIIGEVLRMINQEMEQTRSLLVIVQQLRQKIGAMPGQTPWCTSGGEAPFFYSHHQVWLTKVGLIKEAGLKIGNQVKADVRKNKLTGILRDCQFNIFSDYGVDDIGSMVDWLVGNGFWDTPGETDWRSGKSCQSYRSGPEPCTQAQKNSWGALDRA